MLRKERERSLYGDEEKLIPPEMLYTREFAEEAVRGCKFVIENCKKLLDSLPLHDA